MSTNTEFNETILISRAVERVNPSRTKSKLLIQNEAPKKPKEVQGRLLAIINIEPKFIASSSISGVNVSENKNRVIQLKCCVNPQQQQQQQHTITEKTEHTSLNNSVLKKRRTSKIPTT